MLNTATLSLSRKTHLKGENKGKPKCQAKQANSEKTSDKLSHMSSPFFIPFLGKEMGFPGGSVSLYYCKEKI